MGMSRILDDDDWQSVTEEWQIFCGDNDVGW